MRANPKGVWRRLLPAVILATVATRPAWAQAPTDRPQEVEMALDHYADAKTADQRASIIDYLQHMDRKLVAAAVVDHIIASRTGDEATAFNGLVDAIQPEGCAALLDRLAKTEQPTPKGKLIVALRHCPGDQTLAALEGCLDDKRPVRFEARGPQPRRVCDLAYDDLFLKLRTDPRYRLDTSSQMTGYITEKTPVKDRDGLIAKLKAALAAKVPSASPSPVPSATPGPEKPTTASITLL